jgi:hypothetical protein
VTTAARRPAPAASGRPIPERQAAIAAVRAPSPAGLRQSLPLTAAAVPRDRRGGADGALGEQPAVVAMAPPPGPAPLPAPTPAAAPAVVQPLDASARRTGSGRDAPSVEAVVERVMRRLGRELVVEAERRGR